MDFINFRKKFENKKVFEVPNSITSTPVVSICVHTYQHKNFIKGCLDSILAQKTNFEFEILLGEDSSTDGTREICIEYAEKYPDKIRLFLHHRENNISINNKPSGRFNFLYNLFSARGKFIALCEGDDHWTDSFKLQKQIDILNKNPNLIASYHEMEVLYKDRTGFFSKEFNNNKSKIIKLEDVLASRWLIPTASFVFRNKIEYPEILTTTTVGDFPLYCLVFSKGDGIFIDQVMACYNKRNNTSHTNSKFILDNINTQVDNIKFLQWFNHETSYKYSDLIIKRIDENLNTIISYKNKFLNSRGYRFLVKIKFIVTKFFRLDK